MKRLNENIHIALIALIAGTLSFDIPHFNHHGLLVILLTANTLVYLAFKPALLRVRLKCAMLFASLFLVCFLGLINSADHSAANFVLEKKLALLLVPMCVSIFPSLSAKEFLGVVFAFIFSCTCTAIYCLAQGISHYVVWNDGAFFFYRLMSNSVGMHPIYLSMYYCLAIALVFYFYGRISLFAGSRVMPLLVAVILSLTVVSLSGRIAMLMLIVIYGAVAIYWLRQRFTLYQSVVGGIALALAICFLALIPPKNRIRFREAFNFKEARDTNGITTGAAARPYVWNCALRLLRENPVIGVGLGDTQQELNNCYSGSNYSFLLEINNMQLNAHNQFLEQGVALGLIGVIVIVLVLLLPLIHALRTGNSPYLIFLLIFVVSCLTESMLERQSGVLFYAFFNALFFFRDSLPLKQKT
jgi:O-antigen ligase